MLCKYKSSPAGGYPVGLLYVCLPCSPGCLTKLQTQNEPLFMAIIIRSPQFRITKRAGRFLHKKTSCNQGGNMIEFRYPGCMGLFPVPYWKSREPRPILDIHYGCTYTSITSKKEG